jgi:hypothetical protein
LVALLTSAAASSERLLERVGTERGSIQAVSADSWLGPDDPKEEGLGHVCASRYVAISINLPATTTIFPRIIV